MRTGRKAIRREKVLFPDGWDELFCQKKENEKTRFLMRKVKVQGTNLGEVSGKTKMGPA